jgi:hypothetical protein
MHDVYVHRLRALRAFSQARDARSDSRLFSGQLSPLNMRALATLHARLTACAGSMPHR